MFWSKADKKEMTEAPGGTVSMAFERQFEGMSLEKYLDTCDSYELAALFSDVLPSNQPILEAGSGSGRWVAWFRRTGWRAVGVDWSATLNARARRGYGGDWFLSADLGRLPFRDRSFGAVVALGSVEHDLQGPQRALMEFGRVLRPRGIAIVTVPHGGSLKRISSRLRQLEEAWTPLMRPLRESGALRRLFGKRPVRISTLRDVRATTVHEWAPVFMRDADGWHFFEYQFRAHQIRVLLEKAGFEIEREWAAFHEQGLLANFGPAAGKWIAEEGRVELSPLGRTLKRLIPVGITGQMICFVARRRVG